MAKIKILGTPKMQKGGVINLPKAQYRRPVNSKSTDSLRHLAGQMMDYEAIKGSPIGTPLSNWGYHQSQLPYNQVPSNWTPPRTKQEAVDMYMKEIAGSGKLDYYPSAMEKAEAGDFLYNTGRDARAYMIDQYLKSKKQSGIPNRSLYNVDTKSPKWTPELQQSLDQQWSLYEGEIMKLPTNDRRILLNKGRDFFYQNINRVNDQPNPSYEATWKPRIWESVNYYKKYGGTMKKKVQILSAPKYDTGGQWASQKGMELYTPWPLSVHQQTVADPQYRMKSTLQPVPRQQSDIEAEKGEHIVGDFNQDGAPESMAVGGKRHSEGGTPLSVPDGAFVYSDTQKLKIKDPDVLSVFDTKKAATPGKLAKKYPLNEYKALMDNPKTDPLTRKTAEMMYGNNLKKLGQLQVVQEGMKESMGIPASPQQPTMRHGGNIPKFIEGGKKSYDDYTDMGDPQQIQNREYSIQRPSPSPVRRKIQITAAPQNTLNPVANPTSVPNIPGVSPTPGNMQQGLNEPTIGSLKPAQTTMPISAPQYNPSMIDVQPYVPTIPRGTNKMNKMLAGAKDAIGNYRGMNADDMATVALGLKALNTRRYTPWEAPVQVSYPELILESDQPIRNALSEVTNTMQQGLYAGDPKAGRAAALASQGQLLSQAAQAVGQVSNRNAQMANQYSGQIANITNERLAQERERAKRLYDGNIISAQEYQNSLNNLMSEYVGQQAIREQKESERAWVNKTSPYFAVDRKGMPVFKSAEAQARYQQEVLNMKPGESGNTSKTYDDWYKFYTENMKVPPDAAKEMAAKKIEESTKLPHTSKTVSKKTASGTERTTTKKYGGLLAFINRK